MTFLAAIILGLVEGLTEFLPVSSTAHLILMDKFFDMKAGDTFEIVIQLGAILAICWLFRARILHVAKNVMHDKRDQKFSLNIIIAFLPAMVLGALLSHAITEHFFNITTIAITMFTGGFVILAIEKWKPAPRVESMEAITPLRALMIGFCQTLAMIPGVSRSGATIMGAMMLGLERQVAAEFSFFLAIPTMFAASVYALFKNRNELNSDGLTFIAVGFVTSFIVAMVVVKWFMNFISRHGFGPFAIYRIIAGGVLLGYVATHAA